MVNRKHPERKYYPMKSLWHTMDKKYQRLYPLQEIDEDWTELYNKYINNEPITEKEKSKLFYIMISNLYNDKNYGENEAIFKKLIAGNWKYTMSEVIFIIQFMAFYAFCYMKYDDKGNIRKGYEDFEMPFMAIDYIKKSDFGGCYYDDGWLFVDFYNAIKPIFDDRDRRLTQDNLMWLLTVVCHEMVHRRQHYELEKGIINKSAFSYGALNVLESSGYDHDGNYRYRPIEMEANTDEWFYVAEILKTYFPNMKEKIARYEKNYRMMQRKKTINLQSVRGSKTYHLADDYYIEGLLKMIEKGYDVKSEVPQIANVIDSDSGKIVDEKVLLQLYGQALENSFEEAEVYAAFLSYIYKDSTKLDNVNLPEGLLNIKIQFVANELWKEKEYYETVAIIIKNDDMLRIPTSFLKRDSAEIFSLRLQKIIAYKKFLKSVGYDENFLLVVDRIGEFYESIEKEIVAKNWQEMKEEEKNEHDENIDDFEVEELHNNFQI